MTGAPAAACDEAIEAIEAADLLTLGPGSWFTSVLPHLMVRDMAAAIHRTPAHRLVVLNLVPQPGETEDFSPEQHLVVLSEHAPGLRVDTVLADVHAVPLAAAAGSRPRGGWAPGWSWRRSPRTTVRGMIPPRWPRPWRGSWQLPCERTDGVGQVANTSDVTTGASDAPDFWWWRACDFWWCRSQARRHCGAGVSAGVLCWGFAARCRRR